MRVFGFRVRLVVPGPDGGILHSELTYGTGVILVATADPKLHRSSPHHLAGQMTQGLLVFVDDVDTLCARARTAGATIVTEPTTQHYGDRLYQASDCEGHRWWFAERVDDEAWKRASGQRPA